MKKSKIVKAVLLAGVLSTCIELQAGFLAMLKGSESEEFALEKKWQKVAFVGNAEIKAVHGRAERLTGIDQWTPLPRGAHLAPGDMIRTHQGSSVILKMSQSGSLIKVTPGTILRLAPLDQGWDRSVLSGKEEKKGFSVRSLRGRAYYLEQSSDWQLVEVGSVLPYGTVVKTDSKSFLDLLNRESGGFVRVHPRTELRLDPQANFARRVKGTPVLAASERPIPAGK